MYEQFNTTIKRSMLYGGLNYIEMTMVHMACVICRQNSRVTPFSNDCFIPLN